MWHNLNIQFKYVAIVDLTLIKISLLNFLTRLEFHMYNIFKIMMNYLLPYGVYRYVDCVMH